MTLFDPARHYPRLQLDWHPDTAQLQTAPLPGYPMDDQAFGSDLYLGQVGVLWATGATALNDASCISKA